MEIALGEGLDEEHGVEIETKRASAAKVEQLLVNKAVNVAYASPQGAARANNEGRNIRIYGPWLADHNSLMVRQDSDISSFEDITGKRLGILSSQSGQYNHTALRLAKAGMSLTDDFDLRHGSPGAVHAFDAKKEVAAHMHFIPVTVKTLQEDKFREVEYLPKTLEEMFGRNLHFVCLAAYQNFLDENPKAAKGIRKALIDAAKLVSEDPEKYLKRYKDVVGYENEEQIKIAAKRTPPIYPDAWGDEQRNNITDQLQQSKELGVLAKDAPTDIIADIEK